MPYLNLDDNYPDHPKVDALSNGAYRLHGSALFYVAKWTLDGYLNTTQMRGRKGYSPAALTELINAGLIHDKGQGCDTKTCPTGVEKHYLLHDYLQWNKSRGWWEKKRAADAERLAKWREAHAEKEG